MIEVQTISNLSGPVDLGLKDIKIKSSTNKKSKKQKKNKHISQQTNTDNQILEQVQKIEQCSIQSEKGLNAPALNNTDPQIEQTKQNGINANKKQKKEKVVYERKNCPQQQENQESEQLPSFQQSLQLNASQMPQSAQSINQFEKISLASDINKAKSQNTQSEGISVFPQQNDETLVQDESGRLDKDIVDRLSTESGKKAENNLETIFSSGQLRHTQNRILDDMHKQSFSAHQSGSNIKGNSFYTPQKKLKQKQEVQSYYYQLLTKKNQSTQQNFMNSETTGINRNFTQSPIFTRQKENEEDVKKRRQEDRLKMLVQVLLPGSVTVNSYLDMGCGNCEISAEIGKIYGANHIVGCDVYSEDQFVRPVDTPSSTKFTYIANRSDSLQPLLDQSIDLITCFMVLHHIEALDKNLRELQRIIKDGGHLYIREHDVHSENIDLDKYLRYKHERFDDCGQFMKFLGKDVLKEKLNRFGFIHLGDSLYSDSRPNRQKVYHSLFQYSSEHFNKIEQMNKDAQNFSEVEINKIKKEYQLKQEQINIPSFQLENNEGQILQKKQSSQLSENSKDMTNDQLNSSKNKLFLQNLSSATTATSAISSDELSSIKSYKYKASSDEIKEDDSFNKSKKHTAHVWLRNSGQKKDSHEQNDGFNRVKQYNKEQRSYPHHHYNNINSNYSNHIQRNQQDNTHTKNPNHKYKNDSQFINKKQRKSQVFEYDDEEENFSSNKAKQDQWKVHKNHQTHNSLVQNKQKAPVKQQKPVQLIDILS